MPADQDLIRNPIGTPFDAPATADDLSDGGPGGATLFALLKGILLQLAALNEAVAGAGV